VSFPVQLIGSVVLSAYAFVAGLVIYMIAKRAVGIRLTDEQQRRGADLSIHSIGAMPEGEF
jgi:Amt family ammonium transporter